MIEAYAEGTRVSQSSRALLVRAVEAALESEGAAGDVCVLVVSAARIRALNRGFRGVDAVTDVLTFPAREGQALPGAEGAYLGDIAVCRARAGEQAKAYGHSIERELAFLAVHGALHLLGFDHMNPADEEVMCKKQEQILTKLGYPR